MGGLSPDALGMNDSGVGDEVKTAEFFQILV
jgi:hypothetical protein